jgi:large subunit ribosomal protein L25
MGSYPLHIDLLRVSKSDRVKVKVPIDLKGECPGQRSGGVLSLVMHEIELECTADTIPDHIHAQVGHLEVGQTIKVHELQLPKGAKALVDGDDTVVSCMVPSKKAEEAGAPGSAEPDVIGRKAAEEGEAEAEKS